MAEQLQKEDVKETEQKPMQIEESQTPSHKRKYIQVDYDKRRELLKLIDTESLTIKTAAEKLHINYSNAKNIVKLYKKENRIEKLPKKPHLTLKQITTPQYIQGNISMDKALLPFYDPLEAEQFMHPRGKSSHSVSYGETTVREMPHGLVGAVTSVTDQNSRNSQSIEENSEKGLLYFDFELYREQIMERYFR